jgi:hypothetical protein
MTTSHNRLPIKYFSIAVYSKYLRLVTRGSSYHYLKLHRHVNSEIEAHMLLASVTVSSRIGIFNESCIGLFSNVIK